jgi:hypothetical protein
MNDFSEKPEFMDIICNGFGIKETILEVLKRKEQ